MEGTTMDRLDPLTGWRGVAAYSVLIAHAIHSSFYIGGVSYFGDFATRLAYFGMSLFFVLSGFVIHYNYAKSFASDGLGVAVRRFFAARFARLYPLYAVSILISLPHVPPPNFAGSVGTYLAYLTLTQSWFNVELAAFAPAWSISAEWFFYFAFVPLTFVLLRIAQPLLILIIFSIGMTLTLIVVFFFFSAELGAFAQRWFWLNATVSAGGWEWISYFSPYTRILEFVCGLLAAKAYSAIGPQRVLPMGAWLGIIVGLAWCAAVIFIGKLTFNRFLPNIQANIIFAPALAILILLSCVYRTPLSRLLSSWPLVFAGEISYSVYVWSFAVLGLLVNNFASLAPSPEAFINSTIKVMVCVALTTTFAYGSYLLIEAPSRRWIRAVLSRPWLRQRYSLERARHGIVRPNPDGTHF
jgi:peptidoglycan/LPS O-acetylase OafA/YrhL